jgi:hypothetical protein
MTAAAHILIGMQNLVTKEVAAKETVVLSVGQILAGTKNNIIPDKAVMRGTLRTFDMDVREQMLGRLQSFASDMARAYRAEARMDLTMGCPPVVNPERETELVHRCAADELGEDAVFSGNAVMASDDMSLFLRERPGCYFRVGDRADPQPEGAAPRAEFEMNEAGLPVGLARRARGPAKSPRRLRNRATHRLDAQVHIWSGGKPANLRHRQVPAFTRDELLNEMREAAGRGHHPSADLVGSQRQRSGHRGGLPAPRSLRDPRQLPAREAGEPRADRRLDEAAGHARPALHVSPAASADVADGRDDRLAGPPPSAPGCPSRSSRELPVQSRRGRRAASD